MRYVRTDTYKIYYDLRCTRAVLLSIDSYWLCANISITLNDDQPKKTVVKQYSCGSSNYTVAPPVVVQQHGSGVPYKVTNNRSNLTASALRQQSTYDTQHMQGRGGQGVVLCSSSKETRRAVRDSYNTIK